MHVGSGLKKPKIIVVFLKKKKFLRSAGPSFGAVPFDEKNVKKPLILAFFCSHHQVIVCFTYDQVKLS